MDLVFETAAKVNPPIMGGPIHDLNGFPRCCICGMPMRYNPSTNWNRSDQWICLTQRCMQYQRPVIGPALGSQYDFEGRKRSEAFWERYFFVRDGAD